MSGLPLRVSPHAYPRGEHSSFNCRLQPSQLIAEYATPGVVSTNGLSYLTSDHLGSTRVVTKADGTVKPRYDHLRFGEEIGSGIGARTTPMLYKGHVPSFEPRRGLSLNNNVAVSGVATAIKPGLTDKILELE
jgi:hypothetical protein